MSTQILQRLVATWLMISIFLLAGCEVSPSIPYQPPPSAAAVAQSDATIQIEPVQGHASQVVEVRGSGWPTNKLIMIHLQDEQGRSGFVATANSSANGEFSARFSWPISERWLSPGSVQVIARLPDDSRVAQTTFTVLDPGAVTATPTVTPTDAQTPEEAQTPTTTATVTSTSTPGGSDAPVVVSGDVEALRLETAPLLDGDLSEWSNATGYRTPFVVEQHPEWNGTMDVDAIWHAGWTDDALYFGLRVIDDRIVQENLPKFAYFGDSVEIELDTDLIGDYGPDVNRDDFQYIVSPGNFADLPPSAFRFQGTDEGILVDAPGTAARVAARRTDEGYNLEFAIPWGDFNVTPGSGLTLGATLSTNDNDVPGSEQIQFLLLSNVPGRQWATPNTWGTLTLQ